MPPNPLPARWTEAPELVQRTRLRPIVQYVTGGFLVGCLCGAGGLLCTIIGLLRAAAGQ